MLEVIFDSLIAFIINDPYELSMVGSISSTTLAASTVSSVDRISASSSMLGIIWPLFPIPRFVSTAFVT